MDHVQSIECVYEYSVFMEHFSDPISAPAIALKPPLRHMKRFWYYL